MTDGNGSLPTEMRLQLVESSQARLESRQITASADLEDIRTKVVRQTDLTARTDELSRNVRTLAVGVESLLKGISERMTALEEALLLLKESLVTPAPVVAPRRAKK